MDALTSHCIIKLSTEGCVGQSFQTQNSIVPFLLKNWKNLWSGATEKRWISSMLSVKERHLWNGSFSYFFLNMNTYSHTYKVRGCFQPPSRALQGNSAQESEEGGSSWACELQLVAQLYVVKGALLLLKISTPLPCRNAGCMFPWDIPVDQSYQTTCQSSRMTSPLEDVHDKMIPKSKLPSSLLQQSYGLLALVVTLTCLTHQNINHPTFSRSLYQSAFLNTFIKTGKEWEVSTKPLINLWFLMSSIT